MAVMAAIVGFTHLLAGFDNPTLVRAVEHPAGPPLHQSPSHLRPAPAQTQRAHRAAAGHTTATNSPRWAGASRCCSPRSTGGSSPQAWPS